MSPAVYVTIAIFIVGSLIGFFKYLHSLDVAFRVLVGKFDERTTAITQHLSKIDRALGELANSTYRISTLEEIGADHEGRIRNIEGRVRTIADNFL